MILKNLYTSKKIAAQQNFKGQRLYFIHTISFDTKASLSLSSEGN